MHLLFDKEGSNPGLRRSNGKSTIDTANGDARFFIRNHLMSSLNEEGQKI